MKSGVREEATFIIISEKQPFLCPSFLMPDLLNNKIIDGLKSLDHEKALFCPCIVEAQFLNRAMPDLPKNRRKD